MENKPETQEKLDLIADKLLVRTQDNLCNWRFDTDKKYKLYLNTGVIYLHSQDIIGGATSIVMDIVNNSNPQLVIATLKKDINSVDSNLVRLYHAASSYHRNYVNTCVEKLMNDIQTLGKDAPF